jgi:uncharacterized protein YndB with AHSA1/START domain
MPRRITAFLCVTFLGLSLVIGHPLHAQEATPKEKPSMNKIVHLSAIIHCNVHRAFEMFTSNKLLATWLTVVAEVEPEVGGKYELFWEPSDRENNSTIGCKVTAVELDRFISFEWRSPKQYKQFANNADPLTHVVVFFIPQGDSTKVYLIHSGWRSTPDWEEARQWQVKAWTGAFEELKAKVNPK